MITVGVDFAAQPSNTAVVRMEWSSGGARVIDVVHPATDDAILDAMAGADAVGLDIPLGWPDSFVAFLQQVHTDALAPVDDNPDAWRRGLAYRRTDRVVAERFGKWPLSVSSDRIALPSMRAAALLARIRSMGEPVDRAGGSRIAEVYPGLAVRLWDLQRSSYKAGNRDGLAIVVTRLRAAAPWLDLGDALPRCQQNDDVFDAVVCALIARAHALGRWHRPDPADLAQARREGWIVVPDCGLDALVGQE